MPNSNASNPEPRSLPPSAVVLAVLVVFAGLGFFFFGSDAYADILMVFGFILTGGAVALAIAIYATQKGESEQSEARIREDIKHVGKRETAVLASAAKDPTEVLDDSGTDVQDIGDDETHAEPLDSVEIERMGVAKEIADLMDVYSPENIPIAVVGSLAEAWRDDEEDRSKWEVGELLRAYRRRGKGNHAWFLVLQDRARNDDEVKVWKVSRGGRGNRGSTATEL